MWAEERVKIPNEIARDIAIVPMAVTIGEIFGAVLTVSGSIILCWQLFRFVLCKCQSREWNIKGKNIKTIKKPSKCDISSNNNIIVDDTKCNRSLPLTIINNMSEKSTLLTRRAEDHCNNR